MRFQVTWLPAAEQRLAKLWLESRSASRITKATDRLDLLLADDPLAFGESRAGNFRIAFESPIAISYLVDEGTRQVIIFHVWLY